MRDTAADVKTFSFEQSVFSQGVATVIDPRLLKEAQYARSVNCYPSRNGRIRKRPGYQQFSTLPVGFTTPRNLRWLVTENGTEILVVWWDDKVGYVDGGGVVQVLASGLNTGGKIATGLWNDKCYYSDGVNGLSYVYKSTEDTASRGIYAWGNGKSNYLRVTSVTKGVAGNGAKFITVISTSTNPVDPDYLNIVVTVDAPNRTVTAKVPTHPYDAYWGTTSGTIRNKPADVAAAVNGTPAAAAILTVTSGGTAPIEPVTITTAEGTNANTVYNFLATADYSFSYLEARPASERMFGVDAKDKTNLRWCNPFDASKWNSGDVYSPGGEFVTLVDTGDAFCCITKEDVYRIDGTDPATWSTKGVNSNGLGCVASRSAVVLEGVPAWLSPRGIVYFDGTKPKPMSSDVFDIDDSSRSILPAVGPAYAVQTGEFYLIYYGNNKVAVYDYRNDAWGGAHVLGFNVVAADANTASANTSMPYVLTSDGIIAKQGGNTDLGAAFTAIGRCRTIDGGRPTLDKIFTEVRCGYYASGVGTLKLRLLCEDETNPRAKAEATVTTAAGDEMLRKRVQNERARMASIEFEFTGDCIFEAYVLGTDLFFCRPR